MFALRSSEVLLCKIMVQTCRGEFVYNLKCVFKLEFVELFEKERRLGKVKIACNFRFASRTGKNASELSNRMRVGKHSRFARQPEAVQEPMQSILKIFFILFEIVSNYDVYYHYFKIILFPFCGLDFFYVTDKLQFIYFQHFVVFQVVIHNKKKLSGIFRRICFYSLEHRNICCQNPSFISIDQP